MEARGGRSDRAGSGSVEELAAYKSTSMQRERMLLGERGSTVVT